MNTKLDSTADNPPSLDRLPERWALVVSLLIVGLTLYPFDFTTLGYESRLSVFMRQRLSATEGVRDDVIVNILLFVPLGLTLGAFLLKKRSPIKAAILTTVGGGLFSAVIEGLQMFLPFRFSSIFDIASNMAGSLLGFALFLFTRRQLTDLVMGFAHRHVVTRLAILFAAILVFYTLLVFPLLHASRITGWEKSYPLTLGNNGGGTQPWSGKIWEVGFSRLGMNPTEVEQTFARNELTPVDKKNIVCKYEVRGWEQVRSGVKSMPSLVTRKTFFEGQKELVKWLKTKTSAEYLSSSISSTGRFSLFLSFTSDLASSHEPGQLLAISRNSEQLNLAIAQSGRDLLISLRTMTAGLGGNRPQFVVPDFFRDTKKHTMLVTCEKWVLRVYLDNAADVHTFTIGPGLALTNRFLPTYKALDITSVFADVNEVLFALLIVVPLGFIASRILYELRRRRFIAGSAAGACLLLPPTTISFAVSFMTGRPFDATNFFMMCLFMLLATSLMFFAFPREKKSVVTAYDSSLDPSITPIVHEHFL